MALDERTNEHLAKRSNLGLTQTLDPTAHLQEIEKTEEHGELTIMYSQQRPVARGLQVNFPEKL